MIQKKQKKNKSIKKFRIGLLIDNLNLDYFFFEILIWMKKNPNIELFFLIQNLQKKNFFEKFVHLIKKKIFFSSLIFKTIILLERFFLLGEYNFKCFFTNYNVKNMNIKKIQLKPQLNDSEIYLSFKKSSIEEIKKNKIDLILRCGSKILRGKILSCCKFGVLSYHHGDNSYFRGSPAGFWEVYFSNKLTGFIIQKLNNKLDNGKILFKKNFKTLPYFLQNQINVKFRSNYYLKEILSNIVRNKSMKFNSKERNVGKIYKNPSINQCIFYLFKIFYRRIFKIKTTNDWNIALSKNKFNKVNHANSIKAEKPKDSFFADPFVIKNNGKIFIFFENYSYKKNKGTIGILELKKNKLVNYKTILDEKFHLSFPFVFSFNNKYYLIPDSSENKDLRLYECVKFPFKWKLKKIIFRNIRTTDTLVFKLKNHWIMMTNSNPSRLGDLDSELFSFYSDNPINGTWKQIDLDFNDKKSFIFRNGGLILDNNKVLRVSQDFNFNDYGNNILYQEVNFFKKKLFLKNRKLLNGKLLKKVRKCHHMHSNNNITVYDYV